MMLFKLVPVKIAVKFKPAKFKSSFVSDVRTFVVMLLFGVKAACVHKAHDTEQLNLFYMLIGLTDYEKQTSCT